MRVPVTSSHSAYERSLNPLVNASWGWVVAREMMLDGRDGVGRRTRSLALDSTGGGGARVVYLVVVIRLLGLAVIRLIDWVWWGSSGRSGLAGVAWHVKEAARRPSLPLAWFGSLRRETAHVPRAVVVTVFVGCVLLCMAFGVLDFLDVVDPD